MSARARAPATALVVAGGTGSRLGGTPKQFRDLGGRPLLAWSCARFCAHPGIDRLVVVLPSELAVEPPEWLDAFHPRVVAGGDSRMASVHRGLQAVDGDPGDVVLIHDAARPFVAADLLDRLLAAAADGPVIPVLEMVDAVKQLGAAVGGGGSRGRVEKTLDRSLLRAAQTPQAFPLAVIRDLHAAAAAATGPGGAGGSVAAPDDAALCEAAGIAVATIPGDPVARKITHPEDLEFAEWLVETGRVTWPGGV